MKCPICGNDVEIMKKAVGKDADGAVIYNRYAICRDCRKQWNLDKQKAKKTSNAASKVQEENKMAAKPAAEAPAAEAPVVEAAPVVETAPVVEAAPVVETAPVVEAAPVVETAPVVEAASVTREVPAVEAEPAPEAAPALSETKVFTSEEVKKVLNNVEEPAEPVKKRKIKLDENGQPIRKKKIKLDENGQPIRKKRPVSAETTDTDRKAAEPKKAAAPKKAAKAAEQKYGNIPSEKVRNSGEKAVKDNYREMLETDPRTKRRNKKIDPEFMEEEMDDTPSKFHMIRILFGMVTLAAFIFMTYEGFIGLLDGISTASLSQVGMTYIIIAGCMLVNAIMILALQNVSNIIPFLLSAIIYAGAGGYAFLNRGDDKIVFYAAVGSIVAAVLFFIMGIIPSKKNKKDDYDDPFESDYE